MHGVLNTETRLRQPVAPASVWRPDLIAFTEAARGTAEGHFPYDFGPASTMTNANVDQVVTGTKGRELSMSFKGGTTAVTVPENVPVVTPVPASRADLVPGKKVFLVVT